MRRLEGEHLAMLGKRCFDVTQWRARSRGKHQLGGFVFDDAAICTGVDDIAIEPQAVKIL